MLAEKHILKVSELTKDIKLILENTFGLVWVEGEVSNLRRPSSGHIYFTLKDEFSQIRCVLFKQQSAGIKFQLKDGLQIVVFAKLSVYERDGCYQLYINSVEPKGKGSLQLAFEQLKERLTREGLFDAAHKKPLPFLPGIIGIITSPTGAVIRDMLHILEKRFENFQVLIYPAKVQGESAKAEIAQAIEYFNSQGNVDVIILARGGGSIEDLWAFNEELVARAIYNSKIPIISAIGHETDFTIADFVSDLRAPTPSRAAELVIPQKKELSEKIKYFIQQLNRGLRDFIPAYQQRVDDLTESLRRGLENILIGKKQQFELAISKLQALNPLDILNRGYSISLKLPGRQILKDTKSLRPGEHINTKLHKGSFSSVVEEIRHEA
ncbi:MAG: exodeoxyribonuclease VII large subunit [Candidatus Omnitrophica bacterium]|nr:exodeoxyribonuclease VII large subunit [Candidatus Omnitrophota bacterium]MDD5351581.1 exodeoxyribonuclease VII large subunit [Candidatus Omnitrophota bacterium]MDD5551016.1 exodeoxyribonuclease VII large subunit [Candidatus Omnitrophota bacterium]